MNLVEVVVAATVFLGACAGSAQMGAASTAAVHQVSQRQVALEQIEAQLLTGQALLQQVDWVGLNCTEAARAMQQQLNAGMPSAPSGLVRQVSLSADGHQVVLSVATAATGESQPILRQRWLSPAAYGLCGADQPLMQELSDAPI